VSYGGQSGGIRAVQMLKQPLIAMKVVGIPESVVIPSVAQLVDNGTFKGSEALEKAAATMLDELVRWTNALAPLRG
jgi:NAD(P)H-dependent FMN reductase